MERTYGEYSYNPVRLSMRYWGEKNIYWGILNKISYNIIMSCYFDKQTEEQISIQTGVPTAYLEEEIKKLLEYDLITESNSYYQSNIVVITKDEINEIAKANEPSVKEIAEYIQNYTDSVTEKVRAIGFYGSDMPTNSIKWLIIAKLLKTTYINIIHDKHRLDFPIDKFSNNGFRWLVEESLNDELYGLGMSYRETTAGDIEFLDVAGVNGERMHAKVNNVSSNVLVSLARKQPESENEKLICSELINSGLAVNIDKGVKPNCPYFNEEQFAKFMDVIIPAAEEICQRAEKNLEVIRNKVVENAPDRLQDYASKMAQLVQFEEVEDILRILCESGWLLPYKSGMHPTTVIYLK